eukprot:Awhi_evm1s5774
MRDIKDKIQQYRAIKNVYGLRVIPEDPLVKKDVFVTQSKPTGFKYDPTDFYMSFYSTTAALTVYCPYCQKSTIKSKGWTRGRWFIGMC